MYKYLIIGVALMFFSSGAYYYMQGPGGIVIGDAIAGKSITETSFAPINQESISGTYVCNTVATCKHQYTLLLNNDGTVELLHKATSTESPDITESGTWNLEVKNMVSIKIIEKGDLVYARPQKIIIKDVKPTTLSKISYTKGNYTDMVNPIFIRQE